MSGYSDQASIDHRAASAILRIMDMASDTTIPVSVCLVKVAQIMAEEPILTDASPAACKTRLRANEIKAGGR
jgi:hypothetical protein